MSEWQYEGFERPKLNIEDVDKVLNMIRARISHHLNKYGDGIFMHPHELVGCMYGQLMKLSVVADDSIYHGELKDFEERCRKTLLAMIIGTASVQKMTDMRGGPTQDIVIPKDKEEVEVEEVEEQPQLKSVQLRPVVEAASTKPKERHLPIR